jgi:hypothetical protein
MILPLPESKQWCGNIADRAKSRCVCRPEIWPNVSSRPHKLDKVLRNTSIIEKFHVINTFEPFNNYNLDLSIFCIQESIS